MNRGALIASAALHGGVAALLLLSLPEQAEPPRPPPVPVTLVTTGAVQGSPADEPAPEPVAPEFAPEPAPEAPAPTPAPPQAQPQAAPPPAPQPQVRPTPPAAQPPTRPPPQTRAPQRPTQTRPPPPRPAPPRQAQQDNLDLDALSSRLARANPRPAGSNRGAPTQAPRAAGPTPAQIQAAGQQLGARLEELWNPNCRVEGGDRINVRLRFRLENGRVAGRPTVVGGSSADPLERAAEERAIRAVYEGAPYDWLPEVLQTDTYDVPFNAERACG